MRWSHWNPFFLTYHIVVSYSIWFFQTAVSDFVGVDGDVLSVCPTFLHSLVQDPNTSPTVIVWLMRSSSTIELLKGCVVFLSLAWLLNPMCCVCMCVCACGRLEPSSLHMLHSFASLSGQNMLGQIIIRKNNYQEECGTKMISKRLSIL